MRQDRLSNVIEMTSKPAPSPWPSTPASANTSPSPNRQDHPNRNYRASQSRIPCLTRHGIPGATARRTAITVPVGAAAYTCTSGNAYETITGQVQVTPGCGHHHKPRAPGSPWPCPPTAAPPTSQTPGPEAIRGAGFSHARTTLGVGH